LAATFANLDEGGRRTPGVTRFAVLLAQNNSSKRVTPKTKGACVTRSRANFDFCRKGWREGRNNRSPQRSIADMSHKPHIRAAQRGYSAREGKQIYIWRQCVRPLLDLRYSIIAFGNIWVTMAHRSLQVRKKMIVGVCFCVGWWAWYVQRKANTIARGILLSQSWVLWRIIGIDCLHAWGFMCWQLVVCIITAPPAWIDM